MTAQIKRRARGGGRGPRASASAQLSKSGRRLLVLIWKQQEAMKGGEPADQIEAANKGVPWKLQATAEALRLLPASVKHTLANLEARGLVWCLAEGSGRGRRVSHVKLCAEAVAVAVLEDQRGMSQQEYARWSARKMGEIRALEEEEYWREERYG